MEKTEMNKAIAEFMRVERNQISGEYYWSDDPDEEDFLIPASELNYHINWQSLMPVWAKLRPMLEITYERACQLEPYELDLIDIYERNVRAAIIEADLTEAHQAIFEAITYLNLKQQVRMENTEMNKVIADWNGDDWSLHETDTWKNYGDYESNWNSLMSVWAKLRPMLEKLRTGKPQDKAEHLRSNIIACVIISNITEAHQAIFEAITYLNSKQ